MRIVITVLSAGALASCATSVSDAPEDATIDDLALRQARADLTRSGSRLKMRDATGPNGVRDHRGFHDAKLDLDCDFAPSKDGGFRCLPVDAELQHFSDPTCTDRPVRIQHVSQTQPARGAFVSLMAVDLFADPSAAELTGYEVVAETTNTKVYSDMWGDCQERDLGGEYRVYTLKVPAPSTFVRGDFRLDWIGGDRIYAQTVHGRDGSRAHIELDSGRYYDVVLHQTVAPVVTRQASPTDVDFVWAPTAPGPGSITESPLFADASCTKPAAEVSVGYDVEVAPGSLIGSRSLVACSAYRTSFRTIDPAPLSAAYATENGVCTATPLDDYTKYFRIGRPVRRNEYVTGSRRVVGAGRIANYEIASSDGSLATFGELFDRQLGRTCALGSARSGVMTCAPDGTIDTFDADVVRYLDEACTQPVIGAEGISDEACFAGTTHAYLPDAARTSVTLYTGGARLTTPGAPVELYFQFERGGTCYPYGAGQAYSIASQVEVPLAVFDAN